MPSPIAHKQKSGKVVHLVKYRADGKVVTDTFDTDRGAHEYCQLIDRIGGTEARKILHRRRNQTAGAPLFKDWAATYLDPASGILTGITVGTRHGYQRIADKALTPFFGEYPLDTIGRDDVGRWVQWVESQPSGRTAGQLVSAKTVRNYQALLSNMFKAAVDRQHITVNPVRGVKTTQGQSREGVFLSPHEFARILEHIPKHYQPVVVFLANTGARWGEATALVWADVELGKTPPTVSINKAWKKGPDGKSVLGPPKSRKSRRTIPLPAKVVAYLPAKGKPSDLVFPGVEGGRMWYGRFNTLIWKRAVEKSGIGKSPNIHDLRHSYASWLLAAGAPLNVVQAKLGHEDIKTTVAVYGHLAPGADADVVGVLDAALAGVPDPVLELGA